MDCVATFVSPSDRPVLTDAVIREITKVLKPRSAPATLCPESAIDIAFDLREEFGGTLRQDLLALLSDLPIDVFVQPDTNRRKKLLIADMDSTMIGQECIDELAGEIGVRDRVAAITERAMRGEIDFEPALRERVSLLAGLPCSVVDKVIERRITLTPGARTLVQTMRANGAYCSLVSGGFTAFTTIIAEKIGFHENRANILETEADHFKGTVREPILGRDAKRDRLLALSNERDINQAETLAVGDGANDLAMIETAGLGVAFHAKPAVAVRADAVVAHCDLSALLYAQGYTQADFVED